jgi:hypothetical protein
VSESGGSGLDVLFALDAVTVAVTGDQPRVLLVTLPDGSEALPSGPLDLLRHLTLERGIRDWVERQTGITLGYVEQLYTFGDRFRDPRERGGGPRVISAAYLALVREQMLTRAEGVAFRSWYEFLPWEDWRGGRPALIDAELRAPLVAWAGDHAQRRERVVLTFGLDGAPWDPERTLERYELLWEAGLVAESRRERDADVASQFPDDPSSPRATGRPLAADHRRIIAQALGRLRGKIRYRPVVFELVPEEFTLLRLQRVMEALAGSRLHKQNFRRLVEGAGLVEGTGRAEHTGRGRPAELFRFRREVFRERPAPGVYYPGAWWSR